MKKIFSVFLILLLFVFQTPPFVFANDSCLTWQDEGIPKEPIYNELTGEFEIYTPNQLAWIAYKSNSTTLPTDFDGWTFNIMNDIDLSGREWIPINNFSGTINGNNRELSNLYLNSDKSRGGLFALLSGATVSDLILRNVSIVCDNSYVGSLSGYATSSLISNIKSNGSVSGDSFTGGLVGICNSTDITLSSFNGNVVGYDKVGGLVGCYEDTNCRYLVTYMKQSFSSGKVSGNQYVGGLVGSKYYAGIQDCYSLCDVSGNSVIGGLVGIVVNTNNDYQIVVSISSIMTQNTYSFGSVNGNSYVGGVFGGGVDGIGLNYWNINAIHKINNTELDIFSKSGAGCYDINDKKLTITQMKDKNSFSSFDFDDIWNINPKINNGLPHLRNYDYAGLEETPYTVTNILDYGSYYIGTINMYNILSPCYVIIVQYKDKRVVNVEFREYEKSDGIFATAGDIDTVKIMVWDSLEKLKPITNIEIISIQ